MVTTCIAPLFGVGMNIFCYHTILEVSFSVFLFASESKIVYISVSESQTRVSEAQLSQILPFIAYSDLPMCAFKITPKLPLCFSSLIRHQGRRMISSPSTSDMYQQLALDFIPE